MIRGSWCSKSRLAKTAGAEVAVRTPLWREAHWQVKMSKIPGGGHDFWSSDVQMWHAAVARSTFASQNVQNTPRSDHFLKFRCSNMARRCGAKHVCKSKCAKHHTFGPLFEGQMSKHCTPLWRQAHWYLKMCKTPHVRTTSWRSDVQKLHAAVAPSTLVSQNAQNTTCSDHFLKVRCLTN